MGSTNSSGLTFAIFILFLFALFLIPWNGQKYELFTLGKWKNLKQLVFTFLGPMPMFWRLASRILFIPILAGIAIGPEVLARRFGRGRA